MMYYVSTDQMMKMKMKTKTNERPRAKNSKNKNKLPIDDVIITIPTQVGLSPGAADYRYCQTKGLVVIDINPCYGAALQRSL